MLLFSQPSVDAELLKLAPTSGGIGHARLDGSQAECIYKDFDYGQRINLDLNTLVPLFSRPPSLPFSGEKVVTVQPQKEEGKEHENALHHLAVCYHLQLCLIHLDLVQMDEIRKNPRR